VRASGRYNANVKICSSLLFAGAVVVGSLAPARAELDVNIHIGPPAPIYERVPPPPPSPVYVWHPGYYHWNGRQYVWVRGLYVREAHPHGRWVAEHYKKGRDGWYVVPGHQEREVTRDEHDDRGRRHHD
jgi:hypothetical protein